MSHPKKSLFVTFEGGEGSGKSTLIKNLYASLKQQNIKVFQTREPGGTLLGEQVRNLLLHQNKYPISEMSEILLFLTSRAQQIKELIQPNLEKGCVVLCDRYHDSTVAYQGIARGIGQKLTEDLCLLSSNHLIPEVTFLLDLDPKIGLERAKKADGQWDRLEELKLDFHQKVRKAYLKIAKENPKRMYVLDGQAPEEEILRQALKIIEPFIQ